MKKKIAVFLALAIIALSGCSYKDDMDAMSGSSDNQSEPSSTVTSTESSEYPSSEDEISSQESSELSSIVEKVSSVNQSSKTQPVVNKNTSSAKPSSTPPPSSVPPSSEPPPPSSEASSNKPSHDAQNPNQMKAVWISFLEFQSFAGSTKSAFTSKIATYFDKSLAKGLNTVIVQVRPHGDSFYESSYYPWSKSVSGTVGASLPYDPLKIMVEEAHARGLSIHAWLNPYRTMTDKELALVDDTFPVKQWHSSSNRSDYMVKIGNEGRWWLKPGNSEVQSLIVNGAIEIVSNYDVDGIHFDDYFYGGDLSLYGDSKAQAQANTTSLISLMYSTIKSINSSVQFGVSPAGAYRQGNSLPSSDIDYHSTDLRLWCQNDGYIDYVMPQVYWDYDHKTQPFTMTLEKWENFVTADSVELIIGLAPSGQPASSIERQIVDVANSYRANGYCLYRYEYIHNLNIS